MNNNNFQPDSNDKVNIAAEHFEGLSPSEKLAFFEKFCNVVVVLAIPRDEPSSEE